ncbi:hypothetical protein ELG63_36530 [Rhizobium leguminosarum]|uniref:hypothetical protein n=1 Tax=Rhizobium leguminosarum TaxID=384 RepID=UPI001031F8DA|nr:hypothetical protein [Rhizobium leguminosarum]TBH28197.1 hypothetical protein ELG63_36530 [Rhizobium leguminosarum]
MTAKLIWTSNPFAFRPSLEDVPDEDRMAVQEQIVRAMVGLEGVKFDFKRGPFKAAFVVQDHAVEAVVAALEVAGIAVEHEGEVPDMIAQQGLSMH